MSVQAPVPAQVFRQHIVRTSRFLLRRLESESADPGRISDPRTYLNVLGYAAKTDEAWPHISRILKLLAPQMEQAGHRHDWIEQLRTGIGLSQQHEDAATEAELRMQLGHLHQLMGEYEDAKRQFDTSLLTFAGLDDKENCARVWYRIAVMFKSQRKYDEATHLILKALDSLDPDSIDAAHGHFRLGTIYNDLGHYDRARDHLLRTIELCEILGDEIRLLAWSHANIAVGRMRASRYDEARQDFSTALEYFDQIEDPANEAVVTLNLGNILYRQGSLEEALVYFEKARPVFQKLYELPRLAIVYNNIGIILRKLERYEEAAEPCQLAADISRRIGNEKELANAISGLAALAQAHNRHEEALAGFAQALAMMEKFQGSPDTNLLIEATRKLQQISIDKLTDN